MILWLSKQLGTILKSMPLHVYNTLTLVAPRISSAHWLHTLFNSGNAIICKHCNEDLFEVILNSCNQKWSDASTNSFGKSLDLYSRLLISPCIWKFIFWQGLRRTLRVKLVKLVNHRVRRQLKATIVAHVGEEVFGVLIIFAPSAIAGTWRWLTGLGEIVATVEVTPNLSACQVLHGRVWQALGRV